MPKPLIIVESPKKCAAIKKYTDNTCDSMASVGHIKDLPKKEMGIPENADGHIDYSKIKIIVMPDKVNIVKAIKAQSKGREIYLATDPDREGEAIAYDVQNEIGRLATGFKRIEVHQITKQGVQEALRNPRRVNLKTVEAQRCRRIIDRIAGYKLTQYAADALGASWAEASVGRTQSAALKLVWDRDKEIENFKPAPFWKVMLKDRNNVVFVSKRFNSEAEAEALLASVRNGAKIAKMERYVQKESSPPPLVAATLQEKASKRLGFLPDKTMQIAQDLYTAGHISYMRTDSVRMAPETIKMIRDYIGDAFKDSLPPSPNIHTNKGGNTQDAHEAIHPTHLDKTAEPAALASSISKDHLSLYQLIWDYTLASQAACAEWDTIKATANGRGSTEPLNASGRAIIKAGWRKFLGREDAPLPHEKDAEKDGVNSPGGSLSQYKQGAGIEGTAKTDKAFTKPPLPYTPATLLAAFESNNIGRPSTYATMMKMILDRNYVSLDGKSLKHTPKGDAMVQWGQEVCAQLFSPKFTSIMEDDLAAIEEGRARKEDIVNEFNDVIKDCITKAKLIPKNKYHFAGVDYGNKNSYTSNSNYQSKKPVQKTGAAGARYKSADGYKSKTTASGTGSRTRQGGRSGYSNSGGKREYSNGISQRSSSFER